MAASIPNIPSVDFSPFYSKDSTERRKTATAIIEALRDVGFVYLINHPVPKDLIKEAFTGSRAFFDLPLEDKLKAPHPPESWHHRGYSQIGQEKVYRYPDALNTGTESKATVPVFEMKETFDLGRENDTITPNIYPPEEVLPSFRDMTQHLFNTLHEFGLDVLRAIALGLQLKDENFFSQYHGKGGQEDPMHQLRLLHYPAIAKATATAEQGPTTRLVAHTDKGTITLLLQEDDGAGGLEVDIERSGAYVPVPVIPGSIILNVGDLLQMWSNDTLRSIRHRVGLPEVNAAEAAGQGGDGELLVPRRFSIPIFFAPDRDVVIECLDSPVCWGEGRPKRNGPQKAWDYILKSIEGSY